MTKFNTKNLVVIIAVMALVSLVLIGGGCGKKESGDKDTTSKDKEKIESLTEVFGKAKGMGSFKYDMVVTTPGQTAATQKMWFKGKKMRMEMTVEGQNLIYLVDMDKQLAYMYFPTESTAMKIDMSKVQEITGESPTEQSEFVMQYNPVTLGSELLDGKSCLIIEYTAGTEEVKMWVWTKYGIPIRTETATAKGKLIVELKNIEVGGISDSMFELPANVQIMEIPSFGF